LLDFNYFGAEIAEKHRAVRAGENSCQVEDTNAGKGAMIGVRVIRVGAIHESPLLLNGRTMGTII
jgi:hypothetical protein